MTPPAFASLSPILSDLSPRRTLRPVLVLMAVAVLAGPAAGQDFEPRELSKERWNDEAYGISLRLPVNVQTRTQTGDDYLLRVADREDYFTMGLAVRQSRSPLTLDKVVSMAKDQLTSQRGGRPIREEERREYAGRKAAVLYFRVPRAASDREDMHLSQAIIELSPQLYAVFEAHCNMSEAEPVRTTFENVLDTLRFSDPEKIARERREQLERGRKWQQTLTPEKLHEALQGVQRLRLLEDGSDVGFVRIDHERIEQEDEMGVQITVRTRIEREGTIVISVGEYFLADDRSIEVWSVKTTRRPRGKTGQDQTYRETGVRSDNTVDISYDGPYGSDRQRFQRPGVGYLNQVEARLLPHILPTDRTNTYGFYAYNPNQQRITYRTIRVMPTLSGFTIIERFAPNAAPIEARYDSDGQLIKKTFGENGQRELIPATAEELERIWSDRR